MLQEPAKYETRTIKKDWDFSSEERSHFLFINLKEKKQSLKVTDYLSDKWQRFHTGAMWVTPGDIYNVFVRLSHSLLMCESKQRCKIFQHGYEKWTQIFRNCQHLLVFTCLSSSLICFARLARTAYSSSFMLLTFELISCRTDISALCLRFLSDSMSSCRDLTCSGVGYWTHSVIGWWERPQYVPY